MDKILVAGATGYLGGHIVWELKREGFFVRAVVRDPKKLKKTDPAVDDVFQAELTRPGTLAGCCDGIDTVITSVGITRQKDGLTYMDVDYQANLNLMQEALKSGVRRFIYIFIFNAEKMGALKIIRAKQRFADELKQSGLNYCLIKPTGFFSDMREFLEMAKKGTVSLFGKGDHRINPIDGSDLARICVDAVKNETKVIDVGGPAVLTHTGIAETAFGVLHRPVRIRRIPIWTKDLFLFLLRNLSSVRYYGPIEFLMTVLTMDMVAPSFGEKDLSSYFQQCILSAAPGK